MKKFLSVVLAVAMMLSTMAFSVSATEVALPPFTIGELDNMTVEADTLTSGEKTSYDLTYGMYFEAVEDYDTALAAPYANWTADFELEFSKEATINLLGQYDAGNVDGDWLSLGSHTIEANTPVALMEESGLNYYVSKYSDIVLLVNKFNCGIVIEDAAYGTEITLSLTITNPETGDKYVLGEYNYTYGFVAEDAPVEDVKDAILDMDVEKLVESIDYVKEVIGALDETAKAEITTEVIEKIVAAEVEENAATNDPAAFSADATITVDVEVEATEEPALDGAETFDVTAYENGVETTEVDIPVLVTLPIKDGATIAKLVHVHNGVATEITDYWVNNGKVYFWMSEFSYVGIYYAGEATLKFEKTAADTYDIVLEGDDVETVKNFVSGQFNIAVTGDVEYTIAGIADKTNVQAFADGSVLVNVPNFVDGTSWSSTITDAKITLATVKVTSLGAGTITLSDAVMHKHDGSDSNLWAPITTIIGNAASFDIAAEDAVLDTHKLNVKVVFNNEVEYAAADYNAMTVTINGVDFELGSDNADVVMGSTDCSYTVTVDVEEMAAFDIKVAGKGYRTAYYNGTMGITDRDVTFWNNAENNAQVRDVDAMGNKYATSFTNFLAGDIVMDNIINTYDLSAVVGYFGQDDLADYDLNRDGKVDSKDVAYVLVSWGK